MKLPAVGHRLLTLRDVSLLAGVARPVATFWRARHSGRQDPFPAPVVTEHGQDLFDCVQVVDWLTATGCGNNPDVRADAIAFTVPAAQVASDDEAFAGLSALLCLRAMTGPLPDDPDLLLDRVEGYDSDDEFAYAEVLALGDRIAPLGRYADLLVGAALDAAEPFDALVRRRYDREQVRSLDPSLRRLVAKTMLALADEADFAAPIFVVRTVQDIELVIAAASLSEQRGPVRAGLTRTAEVSESFDLRLARRWLHLHGLRQLEILTDSEGAYALPAQSVLALRLSTAGPAQVDDLDAVSNLCLNLSPDNRAVVVGPAASLTDSLLARRGRGRPTEAPAPSRAGELRRDALRTDVVRAVVRLPQGLLREQTRARAALWCLAPSRTPLPMTLCADLTGTLDASRADDLVTDLVAAMPGPSSEVAHQLSTSAFVPTSDLVTATAALVVPLARDTLVGSASAMSVLRTLLERLAGPLPRMAQPEITVREESRPLPRRTLADAVHRQEIKVIPGSRVESADTGPRGGIPIVRHARELRHRDDLPGLTPAELAVSYPQVPLTEAGDIVLSTGAGHAAAVDHLGGAVVAFPARVLRCHRPRPTTQDELAMLGARGEHPRELYPQTFTPEAVAAEINAQPPEASDWKAWPLSLLPQGQVAAVEQTLAAVAGHRAALLQALADTDAAILALVRAVSAEICTITNPLTPPSTTPRKEPT